MLYITDVHCLACRGTAYEDDGLLGCLACGRTLALRPLPQSYTIPTVDDMGPDDDELLTPEQQRGAIRYDPDLRACLQSLQD